jgi:membrane-bound metal-dependent hydrolase YbcI (DUF457 family)
LGRALAALAPRPEHDRGMTVALVIGSIAPDVDAVLMPTGWDWYLLWHQRGTHAIVGTIIVSLVFAALFSSLLHIVKRDAAPARFTHLWLAAWAGALGHITLDLVSGGTIRAFAPFDTRPFDLPLTAMADPLLALPLLAFLLTALIWKRHARRAAMALLVVLASVIAFKAVSEEMARRVYRDAMHAQTAPSVATLRAVEARWGSLFGWAFYDETPAQLRAWAVDARTGNVTLAITRPRPDANVSADAGANASAATSLIFASRDLETVRHFFTLFDLPLVETRPHGDDVDVLWSDIRFCWATDCGLWFGGTFDASGRPRAQVVIIGGVRQMRPL